MSLTPVPNAADRAIAIVTSFQLSADDEELGEELFEVLDDLVRPIVAAESAEDLTAAQEALSNTVIVLAALIDGLMYHCDKEVQLPDLAAQLTGSLK